MKREKRLRIRRNRRRTLVRKRVRGINERPRMSIFRSGKYTYVQMIDDDRGHTLLQACTKSDLAVGGKPQTIASAAALGKHIGERALAQGIRAAVCDRSWYKFHGRVKAVVEGAREAGVKI